MVGWLGLIAGALLFLSPQEQVMLDVPYRDQLDGSRYALANCGPTSLAMVLDYYGIDASLWDLRVRAMRAQHSWVDDEGGYSDSYGVFVYNLAAVAESFGLRAEGLWAHEGSRIDHLREWQPDDLRRVLHKGHPAIVQVQYGALPGRDGSSVRVDHYLVIHGLVGRDFVYNDPLGSSGGPNMTISEDDLFHAMSRASTPRVGFALYKRR